MTTTAVAAARSMRDTRRTAILDTEFPGVADVRIRPMTHRHLDQDHTGEDLGYVEGYVGVWHGLYVGLFHDSASVYQLCSCCQRYDLMLNLDRDALANLTDDPRPRIDECYHCEWLHRAQVVAANATTRWRRWKFRAYGRTPESVLAEHRKSV